MFTYLIDWVNADVGCEASVTAKTRCRWAKSKECGELLCGKKFPLKVKRAIYKRYARPAIPYGSDP